jgi:tetratricopeptide (TPR) repeat protein
LKGDSKDMSLSFQVNQQLDIDGTAYRIAEHPAAPGMPYGQEGRQAIVYQLAAQSEARALKVFKPRFRVPALSAQAERLGVFANLPGLEVCRRVILTPQRHNALLRDLPDLTYAVLMPWIEGETWQGVILAGRPLTREASGALARTLVSILAALEQRSIAHCDLSASNLIISQPLISGLQSSISFVDIEDLYAPGLTQPAALPAGSSGYAHKETVGGLWSAVADRFAGAILIAEMLGWCDTRVRQIAWGEQYFDPSEMQSNTERYQLLYAALKEQAGGALAELFAHAWFSEILDACPAFSDWENALGVSPTEEIMSQVTPPPMPEPEGNLQTRLARAKIESGEVFLALGEADKAVAELEEAYRLFPALAANTYARALWARGEQRENAHNLTGAVADYRLIMQILPDDNPLHSETNSTILRLEAVIMQEHDATSRTQRCSECGREIRADFALCPYCGQPLKKEFLAKAMPRLASGGKYVIVPLKVTTQS